MAVGVFTFWLASFLVNLSFLLGHFDVEELNNIQYGIDILDKPLIFNNVSYVARCKVYKGMPRPLCRL